MALLTCPECNHVVSEYAIACPNCGCPIEMINKLIEDSLIKSTQNIMKYNGVEYDFSDIKQIINETSSIPTKEIMLKLNVNGVDAFLVRDVIKFNNNEIPYDYTECLERMKAYNRSGHRNYPKCPICGSSKVQKISTSKRMVSVATLGIASSSMGRTYECLKCKAKW